MSYEHTLLDLFNLQRATLLEALSKAQIQPEYLSKLTSIASIQTKGLKRYFLEQEKGDKKIKRKHRDDENEEEMQNINSIAGSQKRNRLLMLGIDVNRTSEENDPNVVGFEVRCSFKQPLNRQSFVWEQWITLFN